MDNCLFNLLFCKDLSLPEKSVLAYLYRMLIGRNGIAKYRKRDFVCANIKIIANITGLDWRTVRKNFESLKQRGYIQLTELPKRYKEGGWATWEIKLCYEKLKEGGNKISVFDNNEKEAS